jgi:hypothetical protein
VTAAFGSLADAARRSGLVMCCMCFECRPPEQMWTDENGDTWDVCPLCHEHEAEMIKRREEPDQ